MNKIIKSSAELSRKNVENENFVVLNTSLVADYSLDGVTKCVNEVRLTMMMMMMRRMRQIHFCRNLIDANPR